VSTPAETAYRPADAIAGVLATLAIVCSCIGLVYRPVRLIPFAILIALIAAGMSGRNSRLAAIALGVSGVCFVAGTFFAIITDHPIF
jgi:phosphoglycerol transferase MdoB-like AlkP superfamily enzyme